MYWQCLLMTGRHGYRVSNLLETHGIPHPQHTYDNGNWCKISFKCVMIDFLLFLLSYISSPPIECRLWPCFQPWQQCTHMIYSKGQVSVKYVSLLYLCWQVPAWCICFVMGSQASLKFHLGNSSLMLIIYELLWVLTLELHIMRMYWACLAKNSTQWHLYCLKTPNLANLGWSSLAQNIVCWGRMSLGPTHPWWWCGMSSTQADWGDEQRAK